MYRYYNSDETARARVAAKLRQKADDIGEVRISALLDVPLESGFNPLHKPIDVPAFAHIEMALGLIEQAIGHVRLAATLIENGDRE